MHLQQSVEPIPSCWWTSPSPIASHPGSLKGQQSVLRDRCRHGWYRRLAYLRREGRYASVTRPDIILLDLNMPRKDGREVLEEIKADPQLRRIPVVILTTSQADQDILRSYDLGANCYITKPVDLEQLTTVVQAIEYFWFTVVKLPPR